MPFAGDTTVATLMARVGAVLPPARELGPLAPVLAQAAISEPLARLDAAGLASELEMLLAELEPPEPLPLARTDLALAGPSRDADRDPTERFGLTVPPSRSPWRLLRRRGPPVVLEPAVAPAATGPVAVRAAGRVCRRTVLPGVRRIVTRPRPQPPEPVRRGAGTAGCPGSWSCSCSSSAAGAGLYWKNRVVVRTRACRASSGCRRAPPGALLRRAGLYPELVGEQYSSSVPAGQVISQRPARGTA